MKVKIAILINSPSKAGEIDIEDSDQFESMTNKAVEDDNLFEFLSTLEGIDFIDFEVTDSIDEENLDWICHGRAYSYWFDHSVDFYSDFYQSYVLIFKDNKWVYV